MAACSFRTDAVPDGTPYYANGPMRARTWCTTHHMEVAQVATSAPAMCTLGRIEAATEDALAKIAAAAKASQA